MPAKAKGRKRKADVAMADAEPSAASGNRAQPERKKAKGGSNDDLKTLTVGGDTLTWGTVGQLLTGGGGVEPLLTLDGELPGRSKVAGFDIDFTIIATKSGKKFATGAADWKFWDKCVPDKLRQLHKDGYRVVFFTNQAGIEKQKVTLKEIMTKVNNIIKAVDIPIYTYVCTGNNHFRKPSTAVWDHFVTNCNKGVAVDISKSLYVGDAAGRAKEWAPGKPKDFSSSDRMFAANIGCDFTTPEEYFLGESTAKFDWNSINPGEFLKKAEKRDDKREFHSKTPELVVMVGTPASGKSTFCKTFLKPHGYQVINRDTLGTPAKCFKAAEAALSAGKSAVIDNTNPSKDVRADYVNIAQYAKVGLRCIHLQTPVGLAHHLNFVRQNQTNGEVRRIPDVGYNMYKKRFEEPSTEEGFKEVLKVDFMPKFDSKQDEELFKQWTTGGH